MGRPKQLLEVGGRTMLEAVLEPLAASGSIGTIVLVTHDAIANRLDLKSIPRLKLVINNDERSEMIDSIRMGLRALGTTAAREGRGAAGTPGGILVVPGDQPGLGAKEIRTCIEAFHQTPQKIVIATWQGRRGHPILFPDSFVPFVMSEACDEGLRALPRQHQTLVRNVECGSPAVIRNINTAADYKDFQSP